MLEVLLLPVVVPIGLLEEVIVRNRHMFGGLYFRFLVAVMNDDVATPVHHLTEFESLLGEGAGAVVVAGDRMRDAEHVEAKRF
jgi:hypothetical protein